ncbi:prohibitin family protein [Desulfococcaceae bacterium HSG8]|nr:prohibitin family protein [Desulfococcaceae bacterium HSG8]
MKEIFENFRQNLKRRLPFITIGLLILLFLFVYLYSRIVITIGPGEGGVLYLRFFGGTQINYVYAEGIHFILPWNRMYVYNVRIQEISSELNVLAKSGLQVHTYFSVRYAPEYRMLGVLHQRVGPDYPIKVILPEIESVIRETIGTMNAEDLYTEGREVLTEALDEAIEQIARRYVKVDDVLIRKLELPKEVADAIKTKIREKHLVQAHEYIAKRRRVDARGIRDYNEIITKSLSDSNILKWHGIQATKAFAESANAKTFVIGVGNDGVPIILNPENSNDK